MKHVKNGCPKAQDQGRSRHPPVLEEKREEFLDPEFGRGHGVEVNGRARACLVFRPAGLRHLTHRPLPWLRNPPMAAALAVFEPALNSPRSIIMAVGCMTFPAIKSETPAP